MTWEQACQLAAAMQHHGWEVRAVSPLVKPPTSSTSGYGGYRETALHTASGWRLEGARRTSTGTWVYLDVRSVDDWRRWLMRNARTAR